MFNFLLELLKILQGGFKVADKDFIESPVIKSPLNTECVYILID